MTDEKKLEIPFPKASLNKENGQIAWGHNSYEWYSPGYFITEKEAEEFIELREKQEMTDENIKLGLPEMLEPAGNHFNDGYWLRIFAGQAMQAILSDPNDRSTTSEIATYSVRSAEALILEIKNREENK